MTLDSSLVAVLRARATALIVGFSDALPPYREVPSALVEVEFAKGARANIETFFDYLESGDLPDADELSDVVDFALTRIREGVPLQIVLEMYRVAANFIWEELAKTATPDELTAMRDAGPNVMSYVAAVTAQVAIACVERTADPLWEQRDRKRAVAAALLAGDPVDASVEPAAPRIADSFVVVVFQVGAAVDPVRAGEVRSRLDRLPGGYVLLDGTGWTTLVPIRDRHVDAAIAAARQALAGDRLDDMWVGAALADSHEEIPIAAADARAVSSLCRRTRRAGVLTLPKDVILEFALATGPHARRHLDEFATALVDQPLLAQTLETFFDCDFNQVATARRLGIHRNTIAYRFGRIEALTGCDPQRPRDAMTLLAAYLSRPSP